MPERAPAKSDNRRATGIAIATAVALILAVGFSYFGAPYVSQPEDLTHDTVDTPDAAALPQSGEASWYDFSGEETANGETMKAGRLTAAHPTLPFGTKLEVENVENGRTVIVRVNDRGPYADDRIIDVSKAAAKKLGMIEDGVTDVNVAPVPSDSVDDPGEPIID
jgi:peptidoglycan lytic transglycosylase